MKSSGPYLIQNRFPPSKKRNKTLGTAKKIPLRRAEAWGVPCCSVAQGAGEGRLGVPIEGRLVGHRGTRVVRARAPCRLRHVWMGERGTMRRAGVAAICLALALPFCFLMGGTFDLEHPAPPPRRKARSNELQSMQFQSAQQHPPPRRRFPQKAAPERLLHIVRLLDIHGGGLRGGVHGGLFIRERTPVGSGSVCVGIR